MHDELLEHQAFLERLARRLVRDESAALDLVQDTWLRTLARPPREAGAVRAWLTTVVRRLAMERARGDRNRAERERAAANPEETDGGLAGVDRRLDFQALLLERLRALPEAQRHVLALRYVDELKPQEIAERLRVPLDTVRARLRRGLATLRSELDRAAGSERSVWAVALLPELARTTAVGSVAGDAAFIGGVSVMTTMAKTAVVAVVAAALVGGWWLVAEDAEVVQLDAATVVGVEPANSTASDVAFDGASPTVAAGDAVRETLQAAELAATAGSRWMLRVALLGDFDGGVQAEDARITVRGKWTGQVWPKDLEVTSTLAQPGTVLLDVSGLIAPVAKDGERLPSSALVVEAEHSECVTALIELELDPRLDPERPPAQPLEARLTLQRGAVLVGRVEPTGAGDKLAQALALERKDTGWSREPVAAHRVDADGAFRMVLPRGGPLLVGAAALELRPASLIVEARVGTTLDLGVLRLESGAGLSGVVRAGSVAASKHNVYAQLIEAGRGVHLVFEPHPADRLVVTDERLEWRARWIPADAEGRFEVTGLAPGETYWLSINWPAPSPVQSVFVPRGKADEAARFVAPSEGIELEFGWSTVELVLDLPEGTAVRGNVSGTPQGKNLRSGPASLRNALVQPLGLPARLAVTLDVEVEGFHPERIDVVTPPAGERIVVPVTLRARELASVTLRFEGEALPDGQVFFVHDLTDPGIAEALRHQTKPTLLLDDLARQLTLQDGRLCIENLKPGLRRLLLYPGSYKDRRTTYLLDVELDIEVAAGEKLERTVQLIEGGRLRYDVTDADGKPAAARVDLRGPSGVVETSFIAQTTQGQSGGSGTLHPSGLNDVIQNLPAARYRVRFDLADHATEELDIELLSGERTDVQVRMRRQ